MSVGFLTLAHNDKNKERMEREKVITLLRLVKENGLKLDIAADEICSLFNVVGRSEQLVCEYCNEDAKPTCCDSCLEGMVNAVQKAN